MLRSRQVAPFLPGADGLADRRLVEARGAADQAQLDLGVFMDRANIIGS